MFIKSFLFARWQQSIRIVKQAGLIRALILLLFLFLGLNSAYQSFDLQVSKTIFTLSAVIFALLGIHLARPDANFFKILQVYAPKIYFIEYFLLIIPFFKVFFSENAHFSWILALILPIVFLEPNAKSKDSAMFQFAFLPKNSFEWSSGLRRFLLPIFFTYLGGLTLAFQVVTVPVALILLTAYFQNFYLQSESLQMLQIFADSPEKLLRNKVMQQIGFFVLMSLPLGFVFLYFHAQYWHLLLIFMILLLLVQTASVLGKYAFFTPNEELKSVAVFNYLLLVCLFVPFFAPMPIIMIFYFYRKAKRNLKTYL
ncbi:MAG: hypothetical protein EAZ97_09130 [Bacteroidetes bacterium]|nr:MAG: hypothetical protein EAZ97_09130 [Bacteroidota bacterium]